MKMQPTKPKNIFASHMHPDNMYLVSIKKQQNKTIIKPQHNGKNFLEQNLGSGTQQCYKKNHAL